MKPASKNVLYYLLSLRKFIFEFQLKNNLMRKIFVLCLLLSTTALIFAQESNDDKEKKSREEITNGIRDSRDRLVLELNWNTWLNEADSLNVQNKSRGFNFYFYYDIPLGTEFVSFAPGFGMGNSNIFHESLLQLDSAKNTFIAPFSDSLDYKKNKTALTYLEIPAEFRFRTKKNQRGNRWKFAVGFRAGLLIQSHSKYVGDDYRLGAIDPTDQVKFKEHRIENVAKFRYGLSGRVGYGNINLHAYYGLSDVFDSEGPKANLLEIGLSFNPF